METIIINGETVYIQNGNKREGYGFDQYGEYYEWPLFNAESSIFMPYLQEGIIIGYFEDVNAPADTKYINQSIKNNLNNWSNYRLD